MLDIEAYEAELPAHVEEPELEGPGIAAWQDDAGPIDGVDVANLRATLEAIPPTSLDDGQTMNAIIRVFHDWGFGITRGRPHLEWFNALPGRRGHTQSELDRQIERVSAKQLGGLRGHALRAVQAINDQLVAELASSPASSQPPPDWMYGRPLLDYLGDDDPGDSPDEWLVEGLIAAGVPQILAGHPKSYKTFLLEYLMICAALGVDAFGRFKVRRTRGLILPREDAERETRRRVWRLVRGITHQRGMPIDMRELAEWLTIETVKPFYWADPASMDALKRTIKHKRLGFVAVDSLARTNPGDENSTKDMSMVCNAWADVCLEQGVAAPMIHHFTKSGTGTLLQQLRGSGVIGATMRHAIGVEKAEVRGEPFELSFEGNLHPLPPPFSIQMLDGTNAAGQKIITFEYKGTGAAQPVGTINLDKSPHIEPISLVVGAMVKAELKEGFIGSESAKLSTSAIRKAAGVRTDACEAALAEGLTRGLVVRCRRGQVNDGWRLTELGRAFYAGRT